MTPDELQDTIDELRAERFELRSEIQTHIECIERYEKIIQKQADLAYDIYRELNDA